MPFTFDAKSATFFEENSEVSDKKLKQLILLFLALIEAELLEITRRMLDQDLTIGTWQAQITSTVKAGHVAAALLGRGSSDLLTDQSLRETESQIRFSLERLSRFARLIEERTMPRARDPQAIQNRIRLYARAIVETYERGNRRAHEAAGFRFERNVLGAAEHCPECIEITSLGWQSIGSLKLPGQRLCAVNCKCRLEYAKQL